MHDRIIDIAPQGVYYSTANGINAQGHIVGGAVTRDDRYHALYWSSPEAQPQDLNKLISAGDAAVSSIKRPRSTTGAPSSRAEGGSSTTSAFVLTLKPEFACQ